MSSDEGSYAPRSPDLSCLYPEGPGPTPPAPQLSQSGSQAQNKNHLHPEYKSPPHQTYHAPAPASSYVPPQVPVHHQPHYHPQQPPPLQPHSLEYTGSSTTAIKTEEYQPLYSSSVQQLPPFDYAAQHHSQQQQHHFKQEEPYYQQLPYGEPYSAPIASQYSASLPYAQSYAPPTSAFPVIKDEDVKMPPRKAAAPAPPEIEPSPVRTKFPTARIKRIMQADEEVGKVAQQTPIAVGKALELFMIQLVSKSADVAKEKGSKRVTANMLKQVVETDDQWDFLRDIVSRVEAEKEGGRGKHKQESSSDEEMSEPKKRTRGTGGGGARKKKNA